MAIIEKMAYGAYVKVTDSEGDERGQGDWRRSYFGEGLLMVVASQRRRPGRKFVRFFINEPWNDDLRYITTDIGEVLEENGERLVLKTPASIHTFEWGDNMEPQEKAELTLNVLAALKDAGMKYDDWMKWAEQLTGELGDFKIGDNDTLNNIQYIEKHCGMKIDI